MNVRGNDHAAAGECSLQYSEKSSQGPTSDMAVQTNFISKPKKEVNKHKEVKQAKQIQDKRLSQAIAIKRCMKQNLKLMKAEYKKSQERQHNVNKSFVSQELREYDSKLSTYVMQPFESSFLQDKMATHTLNQSRRESF